MMQVSEESCCIGNREKFLVCCFEEGKQIEKQKNRKRRRMEITDKEDIQNLMKSIIYARLEKGSTISYNLYLHKHG